MAVLLAATGAGCRHQLESGNSAKRDAASRSGAVPPWSEFFVMASSLLGRSSPQANLLFSTTWWPLSSFWPQQRERVADSLESGNSAQRDAASRPGAVPVLCDGFVDAREILAPSQSFVFNNMVAFVFILSDPTAAGAACRHSGVWELCEKSRSLQAGGHATRSQSL